MKYFSFKSATTILIAAVSLVALGAAGCGGSPAHTQTWTAPPLMTIDTSKTYYALFDTDMGKFKVQLFAADAPITVNNFVFLADQKFYDGTVFHRIIQTFMIQGGSPNGSGNGGPGYTIKDELPTKYSYEAGIVAMANAGPNTGGSQFFICTGTDAASLDNSPNYTQFGKVVEGMDVVQKIAAVSTVTGSDGNQSKPVHPPKIHSITIQES